MSAQLHTSTRGISVSEMKRMKRDPLLWLSSCSLGRMRDCVSVRELVHQPSAGPSSDTDPATLQTDPVLPLPADLSHMIEASGNGYSQCNLTWHDHRIN